MSRVSLGAIVATPGALEAFTHEERRTCLARHAAGDWGDCSEHDKVANEAALETGARLLSSYRFADGRKLWVITEATRLAFGRIPETRYGTH